MYRCHFYFQYFMHHCLSLASRNNHAHQMCNKPGKIFSFFPLPTHNTLNLYPRRLLFQHIRRFHAIYLPSIFDLLPIFVISQLVLNRCCGSLLSNVFFFHIFIHKTCIYNMEKTESGNLVSFPVHFMRWPIFD